MTKQREIEILDATIKQLGPDSYLGPWLKDSRARIVADLSSDFSPTVQMPGAAAAEAHDILEAARCNAMTLRENAEKQAREAVEKAYREVGDIRQAARRSVERLIANL